MASKDESRPSSPHIDWILKVEAFDPGTFLLSTVSCKVPPSSKTFVASEIGSSEQTPRPATLARGIESSHAQFSVERQAPRADEEERREDETETPPEPAEGDEVWVTSPKFILLPVRVFGLCFCLTHCLLFSTFLRDGCRRAFLLLPQLPTPLPWACWRMPLYPPLIQEASVGGSWKETGFVEVVAPKRTPRQEGMVRDPDSPVPSVPSICIDIWLGRLQRPVGHPVFHWRPKWTLRSLHCLESSSDVRPILELRKESEVHWAFQSASWTLRQCWILWMSEAALGLLWTNASEFGSPPHVCGLLHSYCLQIQMRLRWTPEPLPRNRASSWSLKGELQCPSTWTTLLSLWLGHLLAKPSSPRQDLAQETGREPEPVEGEQLEMLELTTSASLWCLQHWQESSWPWTVGAPFLHPPLLWHIQVLLCAMLGAPPNHLVEILTSPPMLPT